MDSSPTGPDAKRPPGGGSGGSGGGSAGGGSGGGGGPGGAPTIEAPASFALIGAGPGSAPRGMGAVESEEIQVPDKMVGLSESLPFLVVCVVRYVSPDRTKLIIYWVGISPLEVKTNLGETGDSLSGQIEHTIIEMLTRFLLTNPQRRD